MDLRKKSFEFLQVAIESVLKVKRIYPDVIFVRKQKYGNVVYQTLHPQLKEYIYHYMEAVYYFVMRDQLSKIAICFFDHTYKIVQEKIVFDIGRVQSDHLMDDTFFVGLEKTFRSFFSSLNLLTTQERHDWKFVLQIYTTESDVIPFVEGKNFQKFPWMQVTSTYCKIPEAVIEPVHLEQNDFIHVQIYVEKR